MCLILLFNNSAKCAFHEDISTTTWLQMQPSTVSPWQCDIHAIVAGGRLIVLRAVAACESWRHTTRQVRQAGVVSRVRAQRWWIDWLESTAKQQSVLSWCRWLALVCDTQTACVRVNHVDNARNKMLYTGASAHRATLARFVNLLHDLHVFYNLHGLYSRVQLRQLNTSRVNQLVDTLHL